MNGEAPDRPIAGYALADGHVYVGDAAAPLAAVFQQMGQAVLEEYAESVPRSCRRSRLRGSIRAKLR